MKRYNGEDGSKVEMDPEEAANKSTEGMLSNPNAKEFGDAGTSETAKATPKATPKAAPKAAPKPVAKSESKPAAKAAPVDVTKLSANERTKRNIEENLSGARKGSGPTDTRSANERIRSGIRSAFGMKKGGAVKKMASGGMTSSASKRADGIATKGKTRGKIC
jgi:Meckel syndrome type 1 protein